MLFNSLVFLIFFPVVYGLYRVAGRFGLRPQNGVLLVASYVFYGWWSWKFLLLIVSSSLFDWFCGLRIERAGPGTPGARRWLALTIVSNLTILGIFKYLGFFSRELDALLHQFHLTIPVVELLLPVGLSFYTFQSIGYAVDVYRGVLPAVRSFPLFALFLAYFPHLVAGPIQRTTVLIPQLAAPRKLDPAVMPGAVSLILVGFFKKVFIADNLSPLVSRVFDGGEPVSGPLLILGIYAFTWQIYGDFSGYSDIALGISRLLGIELVQNFRLPFFANGPQDLWRRWHVSLSEWLRDYLYVSLGGNRGTAARTQVNLLLTMILGGLWHGANWTFLVWGAWHGIGLALGRLVPPSRSRLENGARILAMFQFTALGFFVFRARSMGQVFTLLAGAIGQWSLDAELFAYLRQFLFLVGPWLCLETAMYLRGSDLQLLSRLPRPVQATLSAAMLLGIFVAGSTYAHQFIYFQF